jgi:hypothetical protein
MTTPHTEEQFIIETTHGKITGKELFRVRGVEMGWQGSPDEARDVAGRILKAFARPTPTKKEADHV